MDCCFQEHPPEYAIFRSLRNGDGNYGLNVALSEDQTDWYAFFTLDSYLGQQARVVASKVTEEGFALIRQANKIPGEENFYKEPHRAGGGEPGEPRHRV